MSDDNEITQRLSLLKENTKLDLPAKGKKALEGDALDDWILNKESAAAQNKIERGVGLALKKQQIGHGQFTAWLADNGINPRTAQDAIKTAGLFFELSAPNAQRAALLPHRKIQTLSAAPAKVVNQLFDEGALDDVEQMKREEIADIIKLKKALANSESAHATTKAKLAEIRNSQKQGDLWPAVVNTMRMESNVMADKVAYCVDEFNRMLESTANDPELARCNETEREAAVNTLAFNVSAIVAKVAQLHKAMVDMLGPDAAALNKLPNSTPDELAEMEDARGLMLSVENAEKEQRAEQRMADKPRKRGRPTKKSK